MINKLFSFVDWLADIGEWQSKHKLLTLVITPVIICATFCVWIILGLTGIL